MTTQTALPLLNRQASSSPLRVLQFGQGNFLRGFVDWMFNRLNVEADFDASIHIVQSHATKPGFVLKQLQKQGHAYTVLLRGLKNGQAYVESKIIDNIHSASNAQSEWDKVIAMAKEESLRFVVSNTTEAGIVYESEVYVDEQCPSTFPAKVTALLFQRFTHFKADQSKGLLFLPCELIEGNGDQLKSIILSYARDWELGEDFMHWVNSANHFANTLVDRIVPGFPKEDISEICEGFGYQDDIVVCGEPYHLWAIQGDAIFEDELPFSQTDMNVVFTSDLPQYRSRKVKVLNGIHTMSVLLSHLMGVETVRQTLEHPLLNAFIKQGGLGEIAPTIPMDEKEKLDYIEGVMERFANPFMKHLCLSISLNSISKFKVRVLPTLLETIGSGQSSTCLCLSLAALIRFYKVTHHEGGQPMGTTEHGTYPIQDNSEHISIFEKLWNDHHDKPVSLTVEVLSQKKLWGEDLSAYPSIVDSVSKSLIYLTQENPEQAIKSALGI